MSELYKRVIISMKIPKKISTNKIYEGVHWSQRAKDKDLFLWEFLTIASKIPEIESCDLTFDYEFKSRPLDCDNCSYMTKLIIDCLRHYHKIKDDTPDIVKSIKITSKKGDVDKVKILIVF